MTDKLNFENKNLRTLCSKIAYFKSEKKILSPPSIGASVLLGAEAFFSGERGKKKTDIMCPSSFFGECQIVSAVNSGLLA